MRRLLVDFADIHSGHSSALMNPEVKLPVDTENGDEGYRTPTPTKIQRKLWGFLGDDLEEVKRLANGDEVTVLFGGDLTWGTKYPDGLVSTREMDQFIIAYYNLKPFFALPNMTGMYFSTGTASHEFGHGNAPNLVAGLLKKDYPDKDIYVDTHGFYNAGGVYFDVAHHGPGAGIRAWTEGNVARLYARSLVQRCCNKFIRPPDVICRAHYHTYCRETVYWPTDKSRCTEMIIAPSYCGITPHAIQVTGSTCFLTCGLVVFEIIDEKLKRVIPIIRTIDLRISRRI